MRQRRSRGDHLRLFSKKGMGDLKAHIMKLHRRVRASCMPASKSFCFNGASIASPTAAAPAEAELGFCWALRRQPWRTRQLQP